MGQKKFLSKFFWVQQKFQRQKNFGAKKIVGSKKTLGLKKFLGQKKLASRWGGGANYRIQFIDQYEAYIPNLGQIEILNKHFSEQKFFWRIF